jgi:ABC-type nitrate/sulfonate/bicarbonate transport system permease component
MILNRQVQTVFRKFYSLLQVFVSPLIFILLWSFFISPIFHLPTIWSIIQAFKEMIDEGTYFHDILISSIRALMGFIIGFFLGSLTGLLTGKYQRLYLLFGGLLLFLRWTPVLALLPITIRIGGLGEEPKIFLIAWACYFVSWIYTHVAFTKINPAYIWWSDSLGLSTTKRFLNIYIPAISPALIGVARVALAIAILVVVAAELGGTIQDGFFRDGLGYRISRAIETNRNDINIACILTFGMLGTLLDFLMLQFIDKGLRRLTSIDFYRKDG